MAFPASIQYVESPAAGSRAIIVFIMRQKLFVDSNYILGKYVISV
jgi:hypothetical protein